MTVPKEDDCEACFGMGTILLMKTPRFGHPIDHSKPMCQACNGTGKKPKPS
jgi:DnaJ-class molecular chaperone